MNFLFNGDFKIQESWEKRSNDSRNSKSRERPKSRTNLKNNNSALLNAGKNMFESPYEPSTDLLDDDVTKKILKDFAAEIPPLPSTSKSQKKIPMNDLDYNKKPIGLPPKNQKSNNNLPGDDSLISSMAARLKQCQITVKSQRQQLKQKTQTIQKLRTQNQFLRGLRTDSDKVLNQMNDLKSQNTQLQQKVSQMQTYLKKYGVKWVGYNIQGKFDHQSLKKDIKKPKFNYRMPAEIQLGTIQRRIQQLNANLHSQGMGTQVYSQNGVHKFRKAQPLPMGFFANGIAIKGYKFFSYKSKESLQVLSDLVDGYFPYVLKHKYPNGVFLKVVDKLAVKYEENGSEGNVVDFEAVGNKEFMPPSKEQFLNKLPKQVVKNGKVIQIRGQIQKRLNGNSTIKQAQQQQQLPPQTQLTQQGHLIFLTPCYHQLQSQTTTQQQLCTLKIRTTQGKVCIIHLQKESLIIEAYKWMDKIVKQKEKGYQLMGNYPRRVYSREEKEGLEELGLFPNARLHVVGEGEGL